MKLRCLVLFVLGLFSLFQSLADENPVLPPPNNNAGWYDFPDALDAPGRQFRVCGPPPTGVVGLPKTAWLRASSSSGFRFDGVGSVPPAAVGGDYLYSGAAYGAGGNSNTVERVLTTEISGPAKVEFQYQYFGWDSDPGDDERPNSWGAGESSISIYAIPTSGGPRIKLKDIQGTVPLGGDKSAWQVWADVVPSGLHTLEIKWSHARTTAQVVRGHKLFFDGFTVTPANLALDPPNSPAVLRLGGPVGIAVQCTPDLVWEWSDNVSWISSTEAKTQTGSQAFSFNVAENTTAGPRTGVITFRSGRLEATHTVTQFGASYIILGTYSESSGASAGSHNFTVESNVTWSWVSNASWITSSESSSQTGNQSFSYNVSANTSQSSRSATITFSGGGLTRTHTITQSGASSRFNLNDVSEEFEAAGGRHGFYVEADSQWTWTDNASWITSSERTPQGTNNGIKVTYTFHYDVEPNTSADPRTAKITFTSQGVIQIHTVSQSGVELTLRDEGESFGALGGSHTFTVNSNTTWEWTDNAGGWIASSEESTQSRDRAFTYQVSPNVSIIPRSASIIFMSGDTTRIHTVEQLGANVSPEIVVEQPEGSSLTGGVSAVNFQTATIGESVVRNFTIRNQGVESLSGIAVTFDGEDPLDFALESAPADTLSPLQSMEFAVRFAPRAPGVRSATLHITSNDGDENPFSIALSGAGVGLAPISITQLAYVKASNTGSSDQFGTSIAISGDTMVVGAPREDSPATGVDGDQNGDSEPLAGAAYVFVRDPQGTWSQQAYLKASNTGEGDAFGISVAIDGDILVVGAPGEDSSTMGVNGNQTDNSMSASGAAYIFHRDVAGNWTQQAYIKAATPKAGSSFGESVGISGDTVVVGAGNESSAAAGLRVGAVYVFVRDDTGDWSQQGYLRAPNPRENDLFGRAVAVAGPDGDTIVIGSPKSNAAGVAYVFERNGGSWNQQAELRALNSSGVTQSGDLVFPDQFGGSVSISCNTVIVGARYEDSAAIGVNGDEADDNVSESGAAYVFVRAAEGSWNQQAYLKASNTGLNDGFGSSVSICNETLVVGASGEDSAATGVDGQQDDESAQGSGAAYIFLRGGDLWVQKAYLKASNTGAVDSFGGAVAVSGDLVAIGAYRESSAATGIDGDESDDSANQSGAAFLFDLRSIPVPPAIRDVALTDTSFIIRFDGDPGLTDWKLMGSTDLLAFANNLTNDSTIVEISPGNYEVRVDLERLPASYQYYLRVER